VPALPVGRLHRLWRVAEVLAVGVGTLATVPFFLGLSVPTIWPGIVTGERVQLAIIAAVAVWWCLLSIGLSINPAGWAYLGQYASKETAQINMDTRQDSLTIAGLVLAGLALGPTSVTGSATAALVAAFAAFIAAWSAGFFPFRMSSTVVRDALHWTGLGCVLAAVYAIAGAAVPEMWGPRVALFLATGPVAVYSFLHARGHWRSSRPAMPSVAPEQVGRGSC
jgi:hypothetical protein